MVQNKKQTSGKPKFAEVIIGDKEAKEMYGMAIGYHWVVKRIKW